VEYINKLIYRLKLPTIIVIYDVISVIYLESAPGLDPYKRESIILLLIVVDNEDKWEVDKLLRKY
jgi:hypothetical protein